MPNIQKIWSICKKYVQFSKTVLKRKEICKKYARNMQEIKTRYANYAKKYAKICKKYAKNMKKCKNLNMQEILKTIYASVGSQ